MTTDTYRIDTYLEDGIITVVRTDANGEDFDLNAEGEPCANETDARAFVKELHMQGFFGAETRDELLSEVDAL